MAMNGLNVKPGTSPLDQRFGLLRRATEVSPQFAGQGLEHGKCSLFAFMENFP